MPSTFSNLGLTLQATGENANTWGDITNVNLQRADNAITGISNITITGATTLAFSTNSGSTTYTEEAGRSKILVFNGTPGTLTTVTLPNVEKEYLINNGTDSTLRFTAGAGAATVDIGTGKKSYIYVDGSDEVTTAVSDTPPGGSNTQVQFNSSGAFGGSANLVWDGTDLVAGSMKVSDLTSTRVTYAGASGALQDSGNLTFDGSNLKIGAQGDLRLADSDSSHYVALQAPGTVAANVTLTLPNTVGAADTYLKTDGSGNLSFAEVSGGTSWQTVKTGAFTAVAGEGYFCDTSSAAFTATLPASPTLGDEVAIVDYAGTFDTNNLTIGRNSQNIQGSASDLTVSTERAGLTLVYSGATYGWLLKNK